MFCTCSKSSMQIPPGRQSSRRLQLVHFTSNLRGSAEFMNWLLGLKATTVCMASPLVSGGGDDVAHAVELFGLVEQRSRAEALGDLAIRIGGVVGQHDDLDLGRLGMQRPQHIEAA